LIARESGFCCDVRQQNRFRCKRDSRRTEAVYKRDEFTTSLAPSSLIEPFANYCSLHSSRGQFRRLLGTQHFIGSSISISRVDTIVRRCTFPARNVVQRNPLKSFLAQKGKSAWTDICTCSTNYSTCTFFVELITNAHGKCSMPFHSHVERIDLACSNYRIVIIRGMFISLMLVGVVGDTTLPKSIQFMNSTEVAALPLDTKNAAVRSLQQRS
jgi:hypothetical protein